MSSDIKLFIIGNRDLARASSTLLKRRLDIAEIVRKQGEVKVDELSELLNVSGVTIRQDLTYLEQQGYLKRSFGGAIYINSGSLSHIGVSVTSSNHTNLYHNDSIELVKQSISYIEDGDTLFLSNGHLLRKLIPFLYSKKLLKIIVNDLANAQLAKEFTQAEVIIVGGELVDNNTIHNDKMLSFILSQYSITYFIFEAIGITDDNMLIVQGSEQADTYSKLIKHAQSTIVIVPQRLIADNPNNIGKLKDIHVAILSRSIVSSYHQQLSDNNFVQVDSNKNTITYQNRMEL